MSRSAHERVFVGRLAYERLFVEQVFVSDLGGACTSRSDQAGAWGTMGTVPP